MSEAEHKRRRPRLTRWGRWGRWGRALLAVVVIIGFYAVGRATGITEDLSPQRIQGIIDDAGAWGAVVYIFLFAAATTVQSPGVIFLVAASLAYGRVFGFLLGYVGAVISVSVTFGVVRKIGGKPLEGVMNPRMRRLLDRLNERPVGTMILLRTFFWISPPLNYALALSGIRFRDYAVGSAVGLAGPVLLVTLFTDWFLASVLARLFS